MIELQITALLRVTLGLDPRVHVDRRVKPGDDKI
jgi:hypothetical protein